MSYSVLYETLDLVIDIMKQLVKNKYSPQHKDQLIICTDSFRGYSEK